MCTVLTLSRGWRDSWLQCKVDRDACPTIRSIPLKKHSIVTIIRTFCCSPITWREVRNKGPFRSPNSFNSDYNNSSRVKQCWSWNSFLPHDNEFFMVVQVWTFCAQLGTDPIFSLQFFNVLYMAVICAKFEKTSGSQIIFKEIILSDNGMGKNISFLSWKPRVPPLTYSLSKTTSIPVTFIWHSPRS